MKFFILIAFITSLGVCNGQSKQELIASIIKSETLECDCVGIGCMEGENYLKFKELVTIISEEELNELSNHPNAILRMYASIELIEQNNGNVIEMLERELYKNETIETIEGCLIEIEPTYSIIYKTYRGKIYYGIYEEDLTPEEISEKQERLIKADRNLAELDKKIVNSKVDVDWLLYKYIFEFRKYDGIELENIEELAFKKNNSYALFYLLQNHNSDYNSQIDYYFKDQFLKADFDSYEGVFYLYSMIEYLLKTEFDSYKKIVIKKLQSDDSWKAEQAWFNTILKKYDIEL